MKIPAGFQRREHIPQGPVLAIPVRVGRGLDLHHQVDLPAVTADHLGERRHVRTLDFQIPQRAAADPQVPAEQSPQVGVVNHHRLQVPGPAQVELDAPDPLRDRRIEGDQGVLENPPVVVLAAMGNDPAALKSFDARMRPGAAAERPIDQPQQPRFQPVG